MLPDFLKLVNSRCFIILFQFAVVCIVVISHPFLEVRITLPTCDQSVILAIRWRQHTRSSRLPNLPAAKADFITSKMYIIILEYLLANFTEKAFQESPRGVWFWIYRPITTAINITKCSTLVAFELPGPSLLFRFSSYVTKGLP